MDTYEKVTQIIVKCIGCDPKRVTMETSLEGLGIDHLETIEIVVELEDELGTNLFLNSKLNTVGDLVKYVEKQVSQSEKSQNCRKAFVKKILISFVCTAVAAGTVFATATVVNKGNGLSDFSGKKLADNLLHFGQKSRKEELN